MENKDVRWEQRFANYKKALARLNDAVSQATNAALSELEREGLIQRFEYTYELAWKTLQDLIRSKGYLSIAGPNSVLSQALEDGIITDAVGWRAIKQARELLAHIYNEDTAGKIADAIVDRFVHLLNQLERRLDEEQPGPQLTTFAE